ncbi:hypothetical protein HJB56_04980 [Rhizobium lentis]|uniref:hypothetical protein n=1 Tax=Rhizobium lentis TaxID=1138194 RepID=UPI001C82EFD4|nr:hypothetical protein [Rhizobium lentis]MBX5082140.1 hypothetical protein [Rhizobium lentis]MBX5094850.1 hypothetical protein [Rhizobium lentis]MBX5119575.1 hypothetical protein [Rhizobium lentis]
MDAEITVTKIIKEAGGAAAVERACAEAGVEITRDAIYKWRLTGIPDRHWRVLIPLTQLGPEDFYRANCAARDTPYPEPHEAAA